MAWLAILHVLGLSDEKNIEQFEEVHKQLTVASSLTIAAVQFIIIGSDFADQDYTATGTSWSLIHDLPQLHSLYAAAGGASHR